VRRNAIGRHSAIVAQLSRMDAVWRKDVALAAGTFRLAGR
jgi:hypothetical protein